MNKLFLVIGLGSMGKRRIRNLKSLGYQNIIGYDKNEDRMIETKKLYSINIEKNLNKILKNFLIDAIIISVPPDYHHIYLKFALKLKIPAFVEASVLDTELEEIIADSEINKVFIAPSCTMLFHPAIIKIKEILKSKTLGKISNFIYHSGQYLPDWHKYEKVEDYYVSNKVTGGAREIVPFELTWITSLLGLPKRVVGFNKKTIDIIGAPDIDDTYNLLMDYDNFIFNLSVDVVSRKATRNLMINGDKKQLLWNWDDQKIKLYDPVKHNWEIFHYSVTSAEKGYNKNITEKMYIDELESFIMSIQTNIKFPNNLKKDRSVLNLLYQIENSDKQNIIINIE